MSPSEGLVLDGVEVAYQGQSVLQGITLTVAPGEILALLGPNGSGKTTLLRAICGLEPVRAGSLRLGGRPLDTLPTHRRGIGLLFQEPALFPGRTVEENVAYGLDVARWTRERADVRVRELLERLRIADLAKRRAETLSGGERQRTALARTLAPRPALVLLDEPFAAVDPEFRIALREEFREILRDQGVGAIHVTHDPEEALAVGDRIAMLRAGRLVQVGPAEAVVRGPADPEAARFLGYQVVSGPEGTVAGLPRELEAVEGSGATWSGRIESLRPGLGEWRIGVRLGSGQLLEWRPGIETVPHRVGEPIGLSPRRPVRWPGPPAAVERGPPKV